MTLAATRDMLKDERVWCIAARVELHDGDTQHYEINGEGQIIVSVRTLRHGVPIWAVLRGGDSEGRGVWQIPSIGTEVIVEFDDGMFEGDAYIVGTHGNPPAAAANPNLLLVLSPNVEIRSVNGTAKKLSLNEELAALTDKVNTIIDSYLIHNHSGGTLGGGLTGSPNVAVIGHASDPAGTDVVKGE